MGHPPKPKTREAASLAAWRLGRAQFSAGLDDDPRHAQEHERGQWDAIEEALGATAAAAALAEGWAAADEAYHADLDDLAAFAGRAFEAGRAAGRDAQRAAGGAL